MRFLRPLVFASLAALCGACANDTAAPAPEVDPLDTLQVLGTPVGASQRWVLTAGKLVWIPGSELIAFTTESHAGTGCAVKTLDVGTGAVDVIDANCASVRGAGRFTSKLVAAPDGTALYYTGVGVYSPPSVRWPLRVAHGIGDSVTTVHDNVGEGVSIAVSASGKLVAWVERHSIAEGGDSVVVWDVLSGRETRYQHIGHGSAITFSPDDAELLFLWSFPSFRTHLDDRSYLARLSLGDGVVQSVDGRPESAQLYRWGSSGIEVLAEVSPTSDSDVPSEYRVLNLMTGSSVQVATIRRDPYEEFVSGYAAWSSNGDRIAYWVRSWYVEGVVRRNALFVADTRTGNRVRVAFTDAAGPMVFSPDGMRVVYFSYPAGDAYPGTFYEVDVPGFSP